MLNAEVREPYLEAMELEPALVATESDKFKFLCVEEYNPFKAALRFAMYWLFRKKKFGQRWLLPMNQTGAGALTMDDIEVLRSGYAVFSHNARRNKDICILDASRLPVFDEGTCVQFER